MRETIRKEEKKKKPGINKWEDGRKRERNWKMERERNK